jgi:biopolymer transport protein ExbD
MGRKRKVPGINGSSSADIAFMLLLFFLLTTSMDTDQGLPRRLPRPPENKDQMDEQKVNKRNTLTIMVSSDNRIMCAGEEVSLTQLRAKTVEFIENPYNSENLPEKDTIFIPLLDKLNKDGIQMITKNHIISLQCDRGTKYQTYIDVQNELAAAYNDLRDIVSKKYFNKPFRGLDDEEQRQAVMQIYPQKISEAEPKKYGDTKKK